MDNFKILIPNSYALLAGAALLATLPSLAAGNQQDKPNIILIYADDLDADEINYSADKINTWPTFTGVKEKGIDSYTNTRSAKLLTPNIDALAENGIVLTRFYVNATVCTPSRYCLMTGRYATRGEELKDRFPEGTHATLDWSPGILRDESNIAKELRKNGYRTGIVGKWHNLPNEANMPNIKREYRKPNPTLEEISQYETEVKEYYKAGMDYMSEGMGWDVVDRMEWGNFIVNMDWMCEGALKFIEDSQDEPFFLYLPLPVPHGQYHFAYNDITSLNRRVCANGILDEAPDVLPSDEDVLKRLEENGIPEENAMATQMDDYVGAVMDKLEELGLTENTLVIFTSDHGTRGKNSCYEGAARMPFFAYWPAKIEPGTTSNSLIGSIDVTETLIEIAGGNVPQDMAMDSRSFLPQLLGEQEPSDWRKSLFIEAGNTRAVITQRWKYVANRVPPEIEEKMAERPGEVYWSGVDHHNYNTDRKSVV